MSKITDILPDDESTEKQSPLLNSISKENPFSVPENYFDSFPSEIVQKCAQRVEPKKWGEGLLTNILGYKWRIISIMSCLVLFIFVMYNNSNNSSYEALAKNIPDSLIVANLNNNINDISISSLEDMQVADNTNSSAKNPSDSTNTDQDIIAYLMNNNVSVSDIVNE
jgi:hypothetical protein